MKWRERVMCKAWDVMPLLRHFRIMTPVQKLSLVASAHVLYTLSPKDLSQPSPLLKLYLIFMREIN